MERTKPAPIALRISLVLCAFVFVVVGALTLFRDWQLLTITFRSMPAFAESRALTVALSLLPTVLEIAGYCSYNDPNWMKFDVPMAWAGTLAAVFEVIAVTVALETTFLATHNGQEFLTDKLLLLVTSAFIALGSKALLVYGLSVAWKLGQNPFGPRDV